MNREVMFSSKSDNWETPKQFYNMVDSEFNFTLDVCASEENSKCEQYYTKQDNGLIKKWFGNVWCNPPYGRQIKEWVKKAYNFVNNASVIVMLLPARTDTKWFHEYVYNKAEIRFVCGRLKFGNSKNSAPFPSMLAIYRNNKNNKK